MSGEGGVGGWDGPGFFFGERAHEKGHGALAHPLVHDLSSV